MRSDSWMNGRASVEPGPPEPIIETYVMAPTESNGRMQPRVR
jgi:hypothetical protein